jgi:hypothetical protein
LEARQQRCELRNATCSATAICVCRVCIASAATQVFAQRRRNDADAFDAKLLPGSSALVMFNTELFENPSCERAQTCVTLQQLERLRLFASDHEVQDHRNASLTFSIIGDKSLVAVAGTPLVLTGHTDGLFVADSDPFLRQGSYTVAVFLDGNHVDASPFLVEVVERPCTDTLRSADEQGECVCDPDVAVPFGSACLERQTFVGAVAGSLAGIAFVALVVLVRYSMHRANQEWQVDRDELEFGSPPIVLGRGSARLPAALSALSLH